MREEAWAAQCPCHSDAKAFDGFSHRPGSGGESVGIMEDEVPEAGSSAFFVPLRH